MVGEREGEGEGEGEVGGRVIAAWNQKIKAMTAAQAEANALIIAARLAKIQKWNKISIFSDASQLVQSVKEEQIPPWECVGLLFDLVKLLSHFKCWSVNWICRSCNILVHWQCQYSVTLQSDDLHFVGMTSSTY